MKLFNTYEDLIANETYNANTCTVLAFGHENEYYLGNDEDLPEGIHSINSSLFRKPAIIEQFFAFSGMATEFENYVKKSIIEHDIDLWKWCDKEGGIFVTDNNLTPTLSFISKPLYFGLIELDKEGLGTLLNAPERRPQKV